MCVKYTELSALIILTAAHYILKIKVTLVHISTRVISFSSARDENGSQEKCYVITYV